MARLFTSGFELNTNTANVEWTATSGSPAIVSTTVRTGTYSGQITSLATSTPKYWEYEFSSSNSSATFYIRFYLYVATLPGATSLIAALYNSTPNDSGDVRLTSAGSLGIFDNSGSQVGSGTTLSTGQWYLVEVQYGNTSTTMELKVNGVVIATESSGQTSTINQLRIGGNLAGTGTTTGSWFFDDIAINDTTGSTQNGYAGAGNVAIVRPNGTGDINGFLTAVGGTAGAANNYTRVNEVTPNDATSYNANVATASDLFTVGSSGIASGSTITLVQVGVRCANITGADTTAAFKVQAEQKSGGTITQSAAIIPDTTTWSTNGKNLPHNYVYTLYKDTTGASWTTTTLGTMQIGYAVTTAHTDALGISTIWAYIDYIPAAAAANGNMFLVM